MFNRLARGAGVNTPTLAAPFTNNVLVQFSVCEISMLGVRRTQHECTCLQQPEDHSFFTMETQFSTHPDDASGAR